eukprot:4121080-Alexandrium_andersonii.AAC.1
MALGSGTFVEASKGQRRNFGVGCSCLKPLSSNPEVDNSEIRRCVGVSLRKVHLHAVWPDSDENGARSIKGTGARFCTDASGHQGRLRWPCHCAGCLATGSARCTVLVNGGL